MKKYIAEFIGTFALVFCGTGAVIVNQQNNNSLGLIGISIAFGITVTAMIYIFGAISGAHINPAVSIALWVGKKFSLKETVGYILSQTTGAMVASACLKSLFETNSIGNTLPSGSYIQSFSIEFVLTLFLMLTILAVTASKEISNLAGLIIGWMVTGLILFAGPISGGSFNPARSIAPALVSGNTTAIWIYLLAPTLGAVAGMLLWINFTKK